jgi:hypothetical protein
MTPSGQQALHRAYKEQYTVENNEKSRVAYEPPAVVYEAALEVRAGTPLGLPDPLKLGEGE